MVGSMPVTLKSQPQTQSKPPATSAAPSPWADACLDSNSSMEQMRESSRITEQELESQLAKLQDMAKEVEMNSPELAKLQGLSAQLAGNQWEARAQELASRAEDLSAQAQQRAAEVLEQQPRGFTSAAEEGSGWLGIEIGEVTAEKAKDLRLSDARGV